MSAAPIKFTQDDAAALWHAVQTYGDCVKAMKMMPDLTPELIEAEQARHSEARQALRKVQALRRLERATHKEGA